MRDVELTRRRFLRCLSAFLAALGIPSVLRAFTEEDFPVRTVEKDTFRFHPSSGMVRWTGGKGEEPYVLTLDGLVERAVTLSYAELRALKQHSQTSDLHCVEGWSVSDVQWDGFRFDEIVKKVKPKTAAEFAVFHALGETVGKPAGQGHYMESFPVSDLLDRHKECVLALDMGGKPLPHDHGAPLRVVAPYSLGYKNIKYVTRIEFSREARPGWWTLANPIYPVNAPVPVGRLRKK
ncbi:MAG TPA: molybdopterin-dependent oxidoreductase [Dissulfurispiraceae bacterium]|nr:molybdopterin-dependent oxidoreductase [Dissulfurispiraceae bacterium]